MGPKDKKEQQGCEDVMTKMDEWQGTSLKRQLMDKRLDGVGDDELEERGSSKRVEQ